MPIKLQKTSGSDHFQTPEYAIEFLVPYISTKYRVVECAPYYQKSTESPILSVFKNHKFNTSYISDFLSDFTCEENDIFITNPPYSKKTEYLEKGFKLDNPFAFLLPLTTLEGIRRSKLYRKYEIQIIIPNKRINFITPSGKGSGAWFQTAWFCYKLYLPKQLNFIEINKKESNKERFQEVNQ
jgi:hypothetical protein